MACAAGTVEICAIERPHKKPKTMTRGKRGGHRRVFQGAGKICDGLCRRNCGHLCHRKAAQKREDDEEWKEASTHAALMVRPSPHSSNRQQACLATIAGILAGRAQDGNKSPRRGSIR